MEPDYFKNYLQSYLNDHGFDPDDLEAPIVQNNADNANDTFEKMRRAGHSVDEAIEIALQDLFIGIGESPREVLANILVNDYKKRIKVDDQQFLEYWIEEIKKQYVIMQEFRLKDGLGLDPQVLEGSRGALIHRIDQYLNIHGL